MPRKSGVSPMEGRAQPSDRGWGTTHWLQLDEQMARCRRTCGVPTAPCLAHCWYGGRPTLFPAALTPSLLWEQLRRRAPCHPLMPPGREGKNCRTRQRPCVRACNATSNGSISSQAASKRQLKPRPLHRNTSQRCLRSHVLVISTNVHCVGSHARVLPQPAVPCPWQ